MQQLSGSSGLGGTQTPPTSLLFFRISDRRSRGEESREENKIDGSESGVKDTGGTLVEGVVMCGWLETCCEEVG